MYFYFRLIPNINSGRVKNPKWSNLRINKYINWYLGKKFHKKEKTKNIRKKIKEYIVMTSQKKKKLWQKTK